MIVILTDFGKSEGVGVMKGVIKKTSPDAEIIDLFNDVEEYNIKEGAWILKNNFRHFPKGTIFLCVVDPGVGSERQALAIKTDDYFFVGPDNGLMYEAAKEDGIEMVVNLPTEGASKTFHGRDVFSVAAAKLENELDILKLGHKTELKVKLELDKDGEVVRIDNYGNIITNIAKKNKKEYKVKIGSKDIKLPFKETYSLGKKGEVFLIEGSAETLEISIKQGNANEKLNVRVGDKIRIT